MLGKMASGDRKTLAANLGKVRGSLILGTMCSGTDICAAVLESIVDVTAQSLSIGSLGFVHKCSCELVPFKQRFIKFVSSPEHIFADVLSLKEGISLDVLTDTRVMVPPATVIIAGFSCTDRVSVFARWDTLHSDVCK